MKKYGYKGSETSLNGLTKWVQENYKLNGNANTRWELSCKIICEFAKKNIEGFKVIGGYSRAASYAAKKIQSTNQFDKFTEFVHSYF